jgi:hypothetical protein
MLLERGAEVKRQEAEMSLVCELSGRVHT